MTINKKTFREKVYKIIADGRLYNADPYQTTDKVVTLVRNIIKHRIREIEKARKEAQERGDDETARLYRDIIYPMYWMLEQKFDMKKVRTDEFYP